MSATFDHLRGRLVLGAMLLVLATAASADATARLEAGLQAEEGVRAVKRLQHSYGHYLSEGLWDDAADLFTDDAIGEFPDGLVTGRKALKQHFMLLAGRKAAGLATGQLNTHLLLQPIVTIGADGVSAKGAWHELVMLGHYGKDATWQGGVYENDYVAQGGVWKIARMRYFAQYVGAFDDFGHKAPARWNIPYHFDAKHVGVTIPAAAFAAKVATRSAPPASARLQRLEDELAVQNLQHALGYYLDRKLWDDIADLFAEGGSYEVAQRGVYAGRTRIRKALESIYGAAPMVNGELFDHILLQTVVTVDAAGTHAAARTSQLSQLGRNGEYARWELGTYENEFIRQDGVWKLLAVRYFPRLVTDYDLGWARESQPLAVQSREFPPDRAPSQQFAAYPAAQTVGFHFVNPVSGKGVRYPAYAATRTAVIDPAKTGQKTAAASGQPDEAQLAQLQRRLDVAIGADATENLMSSYGYYIDESAWDEMADTYATTGAKEITAAGVYVGPDRIRRILKLRGPLGGRTPNFFTIHQLTQPVINVAADGQSAKARLRLFQDGGNADGSSGSWIGGIYENTAVVENGEWKFGVQDLHHNFNASYRNGWARVGTARGKPLAGRAPGPRDAAGGGITQGLGGARGGNSLAAEFPPDRPIRARQYTFPEVSEPAFHYRNPVSGRMPAELLP